MNRKKCYRKVVLWGFLSGFALLGWFSWRWLDRKITDRIYVDKDTSQEVSDLLDVPGIVFDRSIPASQKGTYRISCSLFGVIPYKEIQVCPTKRQSLKVSGNAVGIYMETKGVLVIDTGEILSESGFKTEPAKNIVQPGDYIFSVNHKKIHDKQELIENIEQTDGEHVYLEVWRNEKEIPLSVTPVKDQQGKYKLGIWVRDDTQGIGTLTYVKEDGSFGALGHGISDTDTGDLMNIQDGYLYKAQILGVKKGSRGNPGELTGLIRYDSANIIGSIKQNTDNGIYGELDNEAKNNMLFEKYPVGYKQEMETGPAQILITENNVMSKYDAEITKIDMNHEDTNKSFVIKVTDKKLLEKTGGIVQGMSGSPVIQNGRIVGAITHVFVQDSTSGYGIFIENMLKESEKNVY